MNTTVQAQQQVKYELMELPSFRVICLERQRQPGPQSEQDALLIANWVNAVQYALPNSLGAKARIEGIKGLAMYREKDKHAEPFDWTDGLPLAQGILNAAEFLHTATAAKSAGPKSFVGYTPAGLYAVVRHQGSYAQLAAVSGEGKTSGGGLAALGVRRIDGPIIELYRNDSAVVPEDELITDICIPVARV